MKFDFIICKSLDESNYFKPIAQHPSRRGLKLGRGGLLKVPHSVCGVRASDPCVGEEAKNPMMDPFRPASYVDMESGAAML